MSTQQTKHEPKTSVATPAIKPVISEERLRMALEAATYAASHGDEETAQKASRVLLHIAESALMVTV